MVVVGEAPASGDPHAETWRGGNLTGMAYTSRASGRKIRDLLADAGFDHEDCYSWYFHQLQQFITYKAERAGIRVETVDAYHTSQRCSECGSMGTRDGDHFSCSECGRGRHADLNAPENIAQREGEPCTG